MCDGMEKRPTVKDILTKFDSAEGTLHKNVLKVSKEIQFNAWLFEYFERILKLQGFVVTANQINKGINPTLMNLQIRLFYMA